MSKCSCSNCAKGVNGRVRFVSYDGAYPNLCSGNLVLNIDGNDITFPKYCLSSGGSVRFDSNWDEHGEWSVYEWPDEVPPELHDECLAVINDNISWGCCGGCI